MHENISVTFQLTILGPVQVSVCQCDVSGLQRDSCIADQSGGPYELMEIVDIFIALIMCCVNNLQSKLFIKIISLPPVLL